MLDTTSALILSVINIAIAGALGLLASTLCCFLLNRRWQKISETLTDFAIAVAAALIAVYAIGTIYQMHGRLIDGVPLLFSFSPGAVLIKYLLVKFWTHPRWRAFAPIGICIVVFGLVEVSLRLSFWEYTP